MFAGLNAPRYHAGAMSRPVARPLHRLLEAADARRQAIVVPGVTEASYGEVQEQASRISAWIVGSGVGPGDVVAMVMGNTLEFVEVFFGITAIGATAAPLNPGYRYEEFKSYLQDNKAAMAVLEPGSKSAIDACQALGLPHLIARSSDDGNLVGPIARDIASDLVDDVDLPALFLHTSGTTSKPKGVPLTHANLSISADNVVETYHLTSDDVALCVMPLFHVHGLVGILLSTMASGGTMLLPPRFSAATFWEDATAHGATWYSAVPTIHQILLAKGSDVPPPKGTFRFVRSCSAALPPALLYAVEEMFGTTVVEAYGMTEAAHQMASNSLLPGERRAGTVGEGKGVDVALLDETGAIMSLGGPAEVVIRGPNVMRGYRDNPRANADAFVHGWFRTGDQGVIDEDGYLTITGRLKEIINRGGEKISPVEVDAVLAAHPAVSEAVCFGVPDEKYGQEVHGAVVLNVAVEVSELQQYVRERLASFKVPKTIYILTELPKTATGKLQRAHVARMFLER